VVIDVVYALCVITRVVGRRVARASGRDDQGEGVISAAIAVLIMAFLGALMWVGLREIWFEAEANTKDNVARIGD
jgi:hypothetical protein